MYILYSNTSFGISLNFFKTPQECLVYVQTTGAKDYKYMPLGEQLPMKFFYAFFWNNEIKGPDIDIDKAKEIKKDEFRSLREEMFKKLDILFMKSIEFDNIELKQQVISAKESLRNITEEEMPNDWKLLVNYFPQTFQNVHELIVSH